MSSGKKTAYYQNYDPSLLDMPEFCIKQDMCDDIADLEDELFAFGQEMVKLSKSLDGLEKSEIAAKIREIAGKHCRQYLEYGDKIESLDEYEGLEEHDEDDDEEDEEAEEDEY